MYVGQGLCENKVLHRHVSISYPEPAILPVEERRDPHDPFVFPTNRGDPVLLRMCKVFQDGGRANRNTHYILILGRKYEEFFVVLLSFLHNAIYSINYIHSVVTLFKEIYVRLTINRLLTFKTFLLQSYCENINQNNDQYSHSHIKRPLSCTIIISIC